MFLYMQIANVIHKKVKVPDDFFHLHNYKEREEFLQRMAQTLHRELREKGSHARAVFFLDHVPSRLNYLKIEDDDDRKINE